LFNNSKLKSRVVPLSKKSLQRFLGSINYYHRFIPNAAQLQAPFYDHVSLVKQKDGKLLWIQNTRETFEKSRNALASTVNLAHPVPDANLQISTDASNTVIGTVLEQFNNDRWEPLGFFSKKLTPTQALYSTFDRELLATYQAIRHFLYFIEGRHTVLLTDYKPLTHMLTVKTDKYSERQLRHISFIAQFVQQVEHVQGDKNVVPDALSRLKTVTCHAQLPDFTTLSMDQAEDPELQRILNGTLASSLRLEACDTGSGSVYFDISAPGRSRTYIPVTLRRRVFDILHNQAHNVIKATLALIKERHSLVNMDRQIRNWVRHCTTCQRTKVQRHVIAPVMSFAVPERQFGPIHIDLDGRLG